MFKHVYHSWFMPWDTLGVCWDRSFLGAKPQIHDALHMCSNITRHKTSAPDFSTIDMIWLGMTNDIFLRRGKLPNP